MSFRVQLAKQTFHYSIQAIAIQVTESLGLFCPRLNLLNLIRNKNLYTISSTSHVSVTVIIIMSQKLQGILAMYDIIQIKWSIIPFKRVSYVCFRWCMELAQSTLPVGMPFCCTHCSLPPVKINTALQNIIHCNTKYDLLVKYSYGNCSIPHNWFVSHIIPHHILTVW